jgi:hypothetical protein
MWRRRGASSMLGRVCGAAAPGTGLLQSDVNLSISMRARNSIADYAQCIGTSDRLLGGRHKQGLKQTTAARGMNVGRRDRAN